MTFNFQFDYEGNHNDLLAEAVGLPEGLEGLANSVGRSRLVAFDPSFRIALSEDCRTQARIHFRNHTNAYHVRTNEYPERVLGVFLTLYHYGSLESGDSYVSCFDELVAHGNEILDKHMMEQVLVPLQHAIGIK